MNPAEHDVRDELLRMLGEIKRCDAVTALAGSADFLGALRFDSMDVVELTVRLDRVYGIQLGARPADTDALNSLDTLATFVATRRTR